MSRRIAILRPEPGNSATAERVRDAGLEPLASPLFEVRPLAWTPPDATGFDGLLLTSANAVRHGGAALASLRGMPVLAVGSATADAARAAGFAVARAGSADLASLLRDSPDFTRLLWLAGRDRTAIEHPALAAIVPIYASEPRVLAAAGAAQLAGSVALIHSARAGMQLAAELARHRISPATIRIAAISRKAAIAAGPGWSAGAIAITPDDDALIAAARPLAIDP
ncbi:uroporphyrinogen-III synthase [Sphingomonas sp.]|uniref:uroporphyrinogen-III synthase n=1 Tax=Sphingomonas sp. TaxID=28214 RepID=UPI002ED9242B